MRTTSKRSVCPKQVFTQVHI